LFCRLIESDHGNKECQLLMFVFLLAQAAALSFSQLRELPPAAAGDAVLRDQQHGHIETFEAPTGGLNAPGVVDGQFVERPTVSGSGCVRQRWTVKFQAAPGRPSTPPLRQASTAHGKLQPHRMVSALWTLCTLESRRERGSGMEGLGAP
jgi:hypothetical protein